MSGPLARHEAQFSTGSVFEGAPVNVFSFLPFDFYYMLLVSRWEVIIKFVIFSFRSDFLSTSVPPAPAVALLLAGLKRRLASSSTPPAWRLASTFERTGGQPLGLERRPLPPPCPQRGCTARPLADPASPSLSLPLSRHLWASGWPDLLAVTCFFDQPSTEIGLTGHVWAVAQARSPV
jgi:hypothetical protein